MNIKKFIERVITSLNLDAFDQKGKRKALKRLLEKLEARKEILQNTKKKYLTKKEKKELKEEFDIILLQIEKSRKILEKLNTHNEKNKKEQ
jgi:gamma-glutamyl phosphate reductase